MARITMRNSQKATFAEVFEIYISAVTARGVKDKTIATLLYLSLFGLHSLKTINVGQRTTQNALFKKSNL